MFEKCKGDESVKCLYEWCKKRAKANRKYMDLDWNNDTETILAQFVKIINKILDGTDYYAQRNSTIGEKNIDIFKKGVSGRVGHLWPRKREQIIHVNFTLDIVEQLGKKMQLPPDSDVKEGRYLKWRAFRGLDFKTAMEMVNKLGKIGK